MNNATIKAADFLPVLDQIIGFMTEALNEADVSRAKVAQLEAKVADADRIILEKVAAANTQVFKEEEVRKTLDALKAMNIIDEPLAIKYAADIKQDPRVILPLLTKISEALISAPPWEGSGIEKEAAANAEDPDGWNRFSKGLPVKLVQ